MPRFFLFVRSTARTEDENPHEKVQVGSDIGAYTESLRAAGILETVNGLVPSSKSARITYATSGNPSDVKVVPGPFSPESLIAGFWIITAKDLDEAIEWAKKAPFRGEGDPVVEVRQIRDKEEFEDEDTA